MFPAFLRYFIVPLIFWLLSSVLLTFFLPSHLTTLALGYTLLLPTLLLTWWVTAFARWLRSKWGWENLAYFLSNLALGLMQLGIIWAVALVVARQQQTLAMLILWLGCLVGIGWVVASIWWRLQEGRQKRYNNLFWRALESQAWIWLIWQLPPAEISVPTAAVKKPAILLPPPRPPARLPLFRAVSQPTEPAPTTAAMPIPPRSYPSAETNFAAAPPIKQPHHHLGNPRESFPILMDAEQESFVAQAKRLVARTETQAEPVPFAQYWPTYAHMSPAQQRWYFYWRTAVRSGYFLPTDLSYLFIYVYECINLIGFTSAQTAFDQLVLFWKHYRGFQPELDEHMIDWLADFLVVHRLPMRPLAWYGQVVTSQAIRGELDLLIEGWLYAGGDCTLLPSSLLYQLAGYSPENSKFYQIYQQQHNLDAAYAKGVHAVDSYLRQNIGVPLFINYMPLTMRVLQRSPFAGALHEYGQTPITIGQVRPWQAQEPLTTRLKSILKQTENILREQLQFKTKLRGIDLPPDWLLVLQQALAVPATKRTVDIDFASIDLLKLDSEEVRRRLIVEEEIALTTPDEAQAEPAPLPQPNGIDATDSSQPLLPAADVQPPPVPDQQAASAMAAYRQRPDDARPGSLTELAEIAAIMGDSTSTTTHLLTTLRQEGWQAPISRLNAQIQGGFLNVLLDQVNEQAVAHLGDVLLFNEHGMWVVAEDYRDEIAYLLDHPAYALTNANGEHETATMDRKSSMEHQHPAD